VIGRGGGGGGWTGSEGTSVGGSERGNEDTSVCVCGCVSREHECVCVCVCVCVWVGGWVGVGACVLGEQECDAERARTRV
jgi:hypothetical protein